MKNEVKVAKELVKLASELLSSLPNREQFKKTYNNQKVDQKLLQELYDKYTDEISVDLLAGAKQNLKNITTKSLKRWLKDNGYEDLVSGKKYDALYDYLMKKLINEGYELIKETDDIYIISPHELYQEADKQYQERNKNQSNLVFNGGLPNKQEIKKLYIEGVKSNYEK